MGERCVTVAVGSCNHAKLQAVETVFGRVFDRVKTRGFAVESGVADQPTTDEESLCGAVNRARGALGQLATADYGVGLEGNVVTIADTMYLHGWVAIIDQTGAIGTGHSAGLELPEHVRRRIDAGAELGPIIQEMLADDANEIRHHDGTNGILSGGLYTRVDEFVDATSCALAKFVKPELYR